MREKVAKRRREEKRREKKREEERERERREKEKRFLSDKEKSGEKRFVS